MQKDLSASEINVFLEEHTGWAHHDEWISRTFVFDDFNAALGFVVRIGAASEVVDHHPNIDIRWNKVTCTLTTHSANALTEKDLALAAIFDSFV